MYVTKEDREVIAKTIRAVVEDVYKTPRFLIKSSNSPIIEQQESKVDVLCCAKRPEVERSLMSFLSVHWHICF